MQTTTQRSLTTEHLNLRMRHPCTPPSETTIRASRVADVHEELYSLMEASSRLELVPGDIVEARRDERGMLQISGVISLRQGLHTLILLNSDADLDELDRFEEMLYENGASVVSESEEYIYAFWPDEISTSIVLAAIEDATEPFLDDVLVMAPYDRPGFVADSVCFYTPPRNRCFRDPRIITNLGEHLAEQPKDMLHAVADVPEPWPPEDTPSTLTSISAV